MIEVSEPHEPYAISPNRLAQIDKWYVAGTSDIDGLVSAASADIAREHPVSRAVEAHLLGAAIRSHPIGRERLADLLAVLLVGIIRGDSEVPDGS